MSCDAVGTVRDPFWNILGQEAAGAFFCGHDHIYARGVAQDTAGNWVRQVIIGNGGAPAPANFYAGPLVPNYMTWTEWTRSSSRQPGSGLHRPLAATVRSAARRALRPPARR